MFRVAELVRRVPNPIDRSMKQQCFDFAFVPLVPNLRVPMFKGFLKPWYRPIYDAKLEFGALRVLLNCFEIVRYFLSIVPKKSS